MNNTDENNLTEAQLRKAAYFDGSTETIGLGGSKKAKKYTHFKSSDKILGNLLGTYEFSRVRRYFELSKLFKAILPKPLLKMICFAYYKDRKLTIQVMHPVGQQEINHKKEIIISICKKIPEFKDILEVTVFRQDKLNKFSKEFNQDYFNVFHPHASKERKKAYDLDKMNFFEERSVGIFENRATDANLNKKFEEIRKSVANNRKSDKIRDEHD